MNIRIAAVSIVLALAVIAGALFALMREPTQPPVEVPAAAPVSVVQPEPSEPAPLPADVAAETPRTFDFEVVASNEARAQGLSGRTELPGGYGMLFVFDVPDRYGFWMKDMLMPIDILWLADDGTIVGIERNVMPSTYPEAFYPPRPVRLVLETRVGEAAAQGWDVGSRVYLPL